MAMNRAVAVVVGLLWLFGVAMAETAIQPRGILDPYLNQFDLECLRNFMNDPAAQSAITQLQQLNLQNTQASEGALLNYEALEISEHLSCVEQDSAECGTVKAFPSREEIDATIAIIIDEIEAKSDEEVLEAVNYDINELCATLTTLQDAIEPHDACINKNLNAFLGLPGAIRDAVIAILRANSNTPIGNPWDLNLTAILDLSAGCDDFRHQVASSIRAQLTSDIWANSVSWLLSNYDVEAFNNIVSQTETANMISLYGCTIPREMICTKQKASFSATCDLIHDNEFDFSLQGPTNDDESVGSPYYNAFLRFSEDAEGGEYPCSDAFADTCFGDYLASPLEIPDLSLTEACTTAAYFYTLTGETPPTPTEPTTPPTAGPTAGPTETSPPITPAPSEDPADDGGLSNPTTPPPSPPNNTAGIVIGVIFAVVVVVGGVFAAFYIRKRRSSEAQYQVQLE